MPNIFIQIILLFLCIFRCFYFSSRIGPTGCFKANGYTLTGDCDKYTLCTEKIMVDLFSDYPEISFDNNKPEKIT